MATKSVLAAMKQQAERDLVAAFHQMSAALGVSPVPPVVYPRDLEYQQAAQAQALAQWAQALAAQLDQVLTKNDTVSNLDMLKSAADSEDGAPDPKNDIVSNLDTLDQMSKAELVALAASLGIETSGATKAALVAAIRAQQGA